MDRFSKSATMLPQKVVDELKTLMEAVWLSEDEAREQASHFLTAMKHELYAEKPTLFDSQGSMNTVADLLYRCGQPQQCDPTKVSREIEGFLL